MTELEPTPADRVIAAARKMQAHRYGDDTIDAFKAADELDIALAELDEERKMKIDLDSDTVIYKHYTVDVVRAGDEKLMEEVYSLLDEAQGEIFSGKRSRMFVVIEVTQ